MIGALNNEAQALIAIHSVLSISKSLPVASCYLIAPLMFDKKIRSHLKRKNTNILSVQELVSANSEKFISFNDMYNDLLIVTTNAIIMGLELSILKFDEGRVSSSCPFCVDSDDAGKKVREIIDASRNASKILEEPFDSLYSLFRVEI